jgi:hypothetical protein
LGLPALVLRISEFLALELQTSKFLAIKLQTLEPEILVLVLLDLLAMSRGPTSTATRLRHQSVAHRAIKLNCSSLLSEPNKKGRHNYSLEIPIYVLHLKLEFSESLKL